MQYPGRYLFMSLMTFKKSFSRNTFAYSKENKCLNSEKETKADTEDTKDDGIVEVNSLNLLV